MMLKLKKKPAKPTRPKKALTPMSDPNLIELILADSNLPWQHRAGMLRDLINNPNPETESIVKHILESLGKNSAQAVYEEKAKKLDAIIKEMMEGPMRSATFVEFLPSNGQPRLRRAGAPRRRRRSAHHRAQGR